MFLVIFRFVMSDFFCFLSYNLQHSCSRFFSSSHTFFRIISALTPPPPSLCHSISWPHSPFNLARNANSNHELAAASRVHYISLFCR